MLDDLWHLRGSVSLDRANPGAAALEGVAQLLDGEGCCERERGPEHIVFDRPFWRELSEPKWPVLGIYDRGRFWIERDLDGVILCYDLSSFRAMVFCLFIALIAFFFGLADKRLTEGGLAGGLQYAVVAFVWLYGVNILISLRRVPSAMRKAVARK